VLIPHLMFAHMLADYVLQTNWLVAQKSKSWAGLALHGGVVGFVSLLAVAPYLEDVWPALILLMGLHTLQDYLKVYFTPRLKVHPFVPYLADQLIHYAVIIAFQVVWFDGRVSSGPDDAEIAFMWTGAAVIAVTRFYEVTWWANWLDMIPYMNRWRLMGYVERLCMLALAASGLWMIAPLCVLPRLALSVYSNRLIWQQRRGSLELVLGIALSVTLGVGLHAFAQI
jgi:hypothetical protein